MRTPGEELDTLKTDHLYREMASVIDGAQGVKVEVDGREMHNFSSNDYLGLAASDHLKALFCEAVAKYGVGSGASRLVCGTLRPHLQLEQQLAEYLEKDRALVYATGFAAASGVLGAILTKGDVVILDKLCHASLIDGARASGAALRVFRHGDLEQLEHRLRWARGQLGADGRILIVTESVFSMDGDRSPLQAIVALKHRYGAWLLVDEAHAFGITGPGGRGVAHELGVAADVDLMMGTLGKAAGVAGGFVAARGEIIELLVNRARSFIYSTAPPPAQAAAAAGAIGLLGSALGDGLRERLWENIAALSPGARSAIVPWMIGGEAAALEAAAELRRSGYLIPAIRFPTVARGTARLRITLSAAHGLEDVCGLRAILGARGTGQLSS